MSTTPSRALAKMHHNNVPRVPDSPRWCERCEKWGDHHTDRCDDLAAPVGGALYRHTVRRGRWRVEAAGPKWVTFRSLEVIGTKGRWLSFKERREDWPNGWTRA